jgi:heme/copper-type cytochrome/quinol oxidase subunit 2
VPTIVHLLLAVVLTLFLAFQASSLVFVLRSRRVSAAGRAPRRADLLWTCIPVVLVLFLAARSWVAVFDIERPAVASAVSSAETPGAPFAAPPR